ncbi:571_t:CDS:2 [Paraglomus occultum]|uniref:571_t:CDS:1 n=1 Tax=Paraglomus occultum TaxID=144539 RepID=A0A9N8ZCD6_9GLOM|nr:571_t:CDS:2 [Paraglomus occultum]
MPKKFRGENTRANERRAAHRAEVNAQQAAEQERREAAEWAVGSKDTSKRDLERARRETQRARKAETATLLEQEEKDLSKNKPLLGPARVSGAERKAARKEQQIETVAQERREIPTYAASNIDDALDLLALTTESSIPAGSSTGPGSTSSAIDRHPERRFRAALAAYEEREMPNLRKEYPNLRRTQLRDMLYKNFQKSPENPFNQTNVLRYNASKEEEDKFIETTRQGLEDRLRID